MPRFIDSITSVENLVIALSEQFDKQAKDERVEVDRLELASRRAQDRGDLATATDCAAKAAVAAGRMQAYRDMALVMERLLREDDDASA